MDIIKIPHQLQKDSFGFVKLKPRSKIPFEKGWQNKPYSYSDIQQWFNQGNNYGVLGGYGDLIIIDADSPEIDEIVKKYFPETFTVKTPKKGHHYYFICKDIIKKITFYKKPNKKNDHLGEIITKGFQAVGSGSVHPETNSEYELVNDVEIAIINKEIIYSEFIKYIPFEYLHKDKEIEISDINISDILNKKGIQLCKIGDQLVGSHPMHGSTNKKNFVVHPEKNVWHCFRCDSGGGAISLIGVLEGIINCHDAIAGALRGDKYNQVIKSAKDKYGFDVTVSSQINKESIISEDKIIKLEEKIKAIPEDTQKTRIPALIDDILKEISKINPAQGDAILKCTIKNHFKFTLDDIKSYEKILNKYRKKSKEVESKRLSQNDLIQKLVLGERVIKVHPAQDFSNGIMSFAITIENMLCLITSEKLLFTFEDAENEGYILKHTTIDTTKFSEKGIKIFIEENFSTNITKLYWKIYHYIERFIYFPDIAYLNFITLWIIGTYIFMIFRYYPYVWLNAEKGSGKTLLMEVLSSIAFNGGLVTNPTEAVIFRDISNNQITMFIDEVEQLRKRDKETYGSIISVLNAGFNKSGVVKRVEKSGQGKFDVKSYSAYSPKMFAGINEIDDVLQDRTVRIPLLRKKEDEAVERYKETEEILNLQRDIRDDLYIFALIYAKEIAEIYHTSEDAIQGMSNLNNRELDIWEPIFLLANVIDSQDESSKITEAMENLSEKSVEEKQSDSETQNETYKLLNVVRSMLDEESPLLEDGNIKIFDAQAVLKYFQNNEDFDWIQKTNILTRRLKKIKIKSEQKRIDGEKMRTYSMDITEFQDLCDRFKI